MMSLIFSLFEKTSVCKLRELNRIQLTELFDQDEFLYSIHIIVGRVRFTLVYQVPGAILVSESEMHRESEMHHFKKIYLLYSII